MYQKPAFSLIELITVMAITAILIGLGLSGLVNLRNSTTVKGAVDEFLINFNSTKNAARNSVITGLDASASDQDNLAIVGLLDYYGIVIRNNTFARGTCTSGSVPQNLSCQYSEPLKTGNYEVINIALDGSNQTGCNFIRFSLTSGRLAFGEDNVNNVVVNNNTSCIYVFSHSQSPGTQLRVEVNRQDATARILN